MDFQSVSEALLVHYFLHSLLMGFFPPPQKIIPLALDEIEVDISVAFQQDDFTPHATISFYVCLITIECTFKAHFP